MLLGEQERDLLETPIVDLHEENEFPVSPICVGKVTTISPSVGIVFCGVTTIL